MSRIRSIAGIRTARTLSVCLMLATAWVFLEWLFFATKLSFMSLQTWVEKLTVLSSSAAIVSLALMVVSLPFVALAIALQLKFKRPLIAALVAYLPSSLLLALTLLVIIDNFTLTLFGLGIRDSHGLTRLLYAALSIELLVLSALSLVGFDDGRITPATLKVLTWVCGIIAASSIPLLVISASQSNIKGEDIVNEAMERPNIVILASDGVQVDRMSLHGYQRSTTPFLDSIKNELLIAENHFTTASDTGGAVISLLTGKLPTTTRVIYPPDSLRGSHSYEHLPGLLQKAGYYNVDISMRHYADPYDLNLRSGFDEANFRRLKQSGGSLVSAIRRYPTLSPSSMLIDRITERVSQRINHIWRGVKMPNPKEGVNKPDERWIRDPRRMEEIRRVISGAPRPFFLNVHMMGTHGERFQPRERVFSTEEDYPNIWSVDGYDDSVLDFDNYIKETYAVLEEQGLLESTILVISSDHGIGHNALSRLPMLIRFPDTEFTGNVPGNTSRLDIAPTLLDAVGIPAPDWMEGLSLIDPETRPAEGRNIFAVGSSAEKSAEGNFWSVSHAEPPWYTLGKLYLINCRQGYRLKVDSMKLEGAAIPGSTMKCDKWMNPEKAREVMLEHLESQGYSW